MFRFGEATVSALPVATQKATLVAAAASGTVACNCANMYVRPASINYRIATE